MLSPAIFRAKIRIGGGIIGGIISVEPGELGQGRFVAARRRLGGFERPRPDRGGAVNQAGDARLQLDDLEDGVVIAGREAGPVDRLELFQQAADAPLAAKA